MDDSKEESKSSEKDKVKDMKQVEHQKVPLYKLFTFADMIDVVLMVVGTICAILSGLSQPLLAHIFGKLINSFGTTQNSQVLSNVSKVSLSMFYLALASFVISFLQVSCWMATGERQSARIRGLYLKTLLRQDTAFFDTESTTGEVIGRMSGDTILIQDAMGEKVSKFVQLISTFFGAFILAFIEGWQLTLVLLPLIPLLAITGGIMSIVMYKMSRRGQIAYAEAGTVVEQTVGGIRTVASFLGEQHAIEMYNMKLKAAYSAMVLQGLASGLGIGSMLLIIFSGYGFAVWYGSRLIITKGYVGGQIVSVIWTVMIGGMSLVQMSPALGAFAAGQAAAYKMFETIKRKPKIDAYDSNGMVLEDMKGEIELKDVYFSYPARPGIQIFSGFSLKIPSGKMVALIGQSGSGKSTVVSLIERFYDPDSGQVLIDGFDLKKFRLSWIRQQIGLVSQEPILFATTIKENIAYGKENATDHEIRTAIELANAAKFIDTMPGGLETMVGEHGIQLSGGQKQRVAIARAILKNPKILLLDEATSALDTKSELTVQDALEKVMCNRTTVVIAHRVTTIRSADMIAVIHMGKIIRKGTHNDLIREPQGAYSELIHLQERAEEYEDLQNAEASQNSFDIHKPVSRDGSQRASFRRSISKNSPESRHRYTVSSFGSGIPHAHHQEIEVEDQQVTEISEKPKQVSIMRLAHLNKPELPILLLGTMAAAIHALVFPMFGLLLSKAIKIFYEPPWKLQKTSKKWALVYLAMGVLNFIAIPAQNYLFGIAGGKLIQRIRSKTFERVVHQEISWFDDPANSSGAVGGRLAADALQVRKLVGDSLALIIQNMVTIAAGTIIAFSANWILSLVIIGISPTLLVQGIIVSKFDDGFSKDAKVMYEEASQVANDAVGSIRTVASFCAENKVMDLYRKKCEAPVKHGVRLGFISGFGYGLSFFILYCTNAFIFYIGALLVKHAKATYGEVFMVVFALTMAAFGLSMTNGWAADKAKAKNSAASIFRILDKKSKINSSSDEGIMLEHVIGDIELDHVSFTYPMRPNVQIFRDLCLHIPFGKNVAMVGESGSGKSTVISLIERFYDPDAGHVYLDNVELQKLNLRWLRQQIGLVSQEPILFNETIRSNIAYGKQGEVSEEEIIAATKSANAHNFISSLPQGYDTPVGEYGLQLSGGQKQRIAIARAILKNPKILLLDEATSALDTESERLVQDALDLVMVNRTTVIVAHRLSTIKGADIIAVLKNGVIVEKGKHDVLMKINDGAYASLVAIQTSTT